MATFDKVEIFINEKGERWVKYDVISSNGSISHHERPYFVDGKPDPEVETILLKAAKKKVADDVNKKNGFTNGQIVKYNEDTRVAKPHEPVVPTEQETKKKKSYAPWLIGAVALLAGAYLLSQKGCGLDKDGSKNIPTQTIDNEQPTVDDNQTNVIPATTETKEDEPYVGVSEQLSEDDLIQIMKRAEAEYIKKGVVKETDPEFKSIRRGIQNFTVMCNERYISPETHAQLEKDGFITEDWTISLENALPAVNALFTHTYEMNNGAEGKFSVNPGVFFADEKVAEDNNTFAMYVISAFHATSKEDYESLIAKVRGYYENASSDELNLRMGNVPEDALLKQVYSEMIFAGINKSIATSQALEQITAAEANAIFDEMDAIRAKESYGDLAGLKMMFERNCGFTQEASKQLN